MIPRSEIPGRLNPLEMVGNQLDLLAIQSGSIGDQPNHYPLNSPEGLASFSLDRRDTPEGYLITTCNVAFDGGVGRVLGLPTLRQYSLLNNLDVHGVRIIVTKPTTIDTSPNWQLAVLIDTNRGTRETAVEGLDATLLALEVITETKNQLTKAQFSAPQPESQPQAIVSVDAPVKLARNRKEDPWLKAAESVINQRWAKLGLAQAYRLLSLLSSGTSKSPVQVAWGSMTPSKYKEANSSGSKANNRYSAQLRHSTTRSHPVEFNPQGTIPQDQLIGALKRAEIEFDLNVTDPGVFGSKHRYLELATRTKITDETVDNYFFAITSNGGNKIVVTCYQVNAQEVFGKHSYYDYSERMYLSSVILPLRQLTSPIRTENLIIQAIIEVAPKGKVKSRVHRALLGDHLEEGNPEIIYRG